MKKLFRLLALIVPFLAVSCVESLVEPEINVNENENTGDKITLTLHSAAPTKTVLVDDQYVNWEEGDMILINDNVYVVRLDEKDPGIAYVDNVTVAGSYTAYYADTWYIIQKDGIVLHLDYYQDYRQGSFDQFQNLMVAQSTTPDLYFYNAASVLKLGLTGDVVVKELSVSGNNDEPMSGNFLVSNEALEVLDQSFEGMEPDTLSWQRNFVNMYMGEKGLQLSGTPEYIYLVVPPQTYENGITVTILDSEGRVGIQKTTKTVATNRSAITKMADFSFTEAEALSVEVTPGQTSVEATVKGQADVKVSQIVVLNEVWDAYDFETEQAKAQAFLRSYGESSVLAGGEQVKTLDMFVNINGHNPYLAAANDYKLLTSYSSGDYALGNTVITDFTTLEATGEAPELTANPVASGTDIIIDFFTSEDAVSVQYVYDPKAYIDMHLENGRTLEDVVNMWGGVVRGEELKDALTETGCRLTWSYLDYGVEYSFILKAVSATGAEKIVRVEATTEEGTWGIVGDVNNWGNPYADSTIVDDIPMAALSESIFVARDVTLPEGDFKIRKDNVWNNFANLGLSSYGSVNVDHVYGLINGERSSDIHVAAGTYDIYLDEANLKLYVMTPGKDYTEALEDAWYLVGSFNDWTTGDENYKMADYGNAYVFEGLVLDTDGDLKFNAGSWDLNRGGTMGELGSWFDVYQGGENIVVPAGVYNVYLDKTLKMAALEWVAGVSTEVSIADVSGLEVGRDVFVKGYVAETYAKGFMLSDGTNNVLVYEGNTLSGYQVGQELQIKATTASYGGHIQLSPLTIEPTGATVDVVLPEPAVITADNIAELADYKAPIYIQYEGTLSVSGSYYNVVIDGATMQGSVAYPEQDLIDAMADMNGAVIRVTGYYVGVTGSNKYAQTMTTSVELVEAPEEPADAVATIAELTEKVKAGETMYAVNFKDAVVTHVHGNNAFIEDETGGVLVYISGHNLVAGDQLNGKVTGNCTMYNGVAEITSMDLTEAVMAEGAPIPCTEITIADLLANYDRYVSCRVLIKNVTVTDGVNLSADRNGVIEQEKYTVNLYSQDKTSVVLNTGAVGDLTCYPTYYKTNQQVGLWRNEDFVVLQEGGTETPEEPDTPATPDYEAAEAATVADFIAAASDTIYYKLTGKVSKFVSSTGRFDLTDNTGTIYCYEVTNYDKFETLSENDEVVIAGLYKNYNGTHELVSGHILSLKEGEVPVVELGFPLTSTVTWTLGNKASEAEVVVNDEPHAALKLGIADVIGEATLTLPETEAVVKTLSFYATGWNGRDGVLEFVTADGALLTTVTAKQNAGANGNSPFTFATLSDEENHFTVEVPEGTTSLTVRTTSAGRRAILFGINVE